MKHPPLAVGGFEAFAKKIRRSAYQATMHRGLPGSERLAVIEPYYAPWCGSSAHGGRMLRIYFLQHWFALSDPMVEE